MYTRLTILTVVVVAAACGLGGLGYHAIEKWSEGLEGARLGEFAEVAEQVRQDVKRKLDEFIRTEQQRKYTDYLYYYVPENVVDAQQLPLLRSPLAGQFSNSLAYGYFQVEPDGTVVTPYYPSRPATPTPPDDLAREVRPYVDNVRKNVLPVIRSGAEALQVGAAMAESEGAGEPSLPSAAKPDVPADASTVAQVAQAKGSRSKSYAIESLKESQEAQTFTQQRALAESNYYQQALQAQHVDARAMDTASQTEIQAPQRSAARLARGQRPAGDATVDRELSHVTTSSVQPQVAQSVVPEPLPPPPPSPAQVPDLVQIRIEPFVPLVVPSDDPSVFSGQVFLLRHVQIEDRHLLQGFQLDEPRLITEVEESAQRFMRDGMAFELPQVQSAVQPASDPTVKPAYTAILDFGFGDLVLNLTEVDPHWVAKRIGELHRIYFGIIATVALAVSLALASLWHNVRAQAILARKKDDFISAVSHELRTPLTSIRMYAEMLEKNWVKSADKLSEYYRTMRQESERLSRLVENVLDFARLQKGRKRYAFELGSINDCVGKVVEMMQPYAGQHGFTIRTDLGNVGPMSFDKDAVTQIVVNLIDNAVKYACCAADMTITVRTRTEAALTTIEVEDHGPGIPHRQRKKVFEQFYRCDDASGAGSPSEERGRPRGAAPTTTTGTGLGLTLVQRFAEAHGGRVEIQSAEPTGTILKVSLTTNLPAAGC